jgi:hypothetical protein
MEVEDRGKPMRRRDIRHAMDGDAVAVAPSAVEATDGSCWGLDTACRRRGGMTHERISLAAVGQGPRAQMALDGGVEDARDAPESPIH